MPPPTSQMLTTMAVADGVAAEIIAPVDGTIWSQPFDCIRAWLPAPDKAALAKVQLGVIALARSRKAEGKLQVPQAGRVTRGIVRSTHLLKVQMQKLVDPDPAVYDGPGGTLDLLASFLMQVDDYWNREHRQVNAITGLTTGSTNVVFFESSIVVYSPKKLDTHMLWAADLDLAFSEGQRW